MLLQCSKMVGGYGAVKILDGCDIACDSGKVTVIVGPNGAGKSTAMKAIFGMVTLTAGTVELNGKAINDLSPQARVAQGMAFVPQSNNVFPTMSVHENLEMGGYLRKDDIYQTIDEIYELFPILREKRKQLAGELSGGQRQQVAVGRALITKPQLLMLDEPTAGISPLVMDELFDRILQIAKSGVAILMVEQNARQALNIADMGYVLVQGQNKFYDTGENLLANKEVRQTFLGG